MSLKLYMVPTSPPVRAVQMTARTLGVELEPHIINILKQENFKEDYLKINPCHTIPSLDDQGFILWDSHAIMVYLIDKYAQNDALYPKDIKKRAIINQMLFFDSSFLFPRGDQIIAPIALDQRKDIPQDKREKFMEGYEVLDKILKGKKYAAGDELSIADFSLIATITTGDVIIPVEEVVYPNLYVWMKRMQQLPCYSVNQNGLNIFRAFIKPKMA